MTTELHLSGHEFDIEVLAGYVDVYIETDSAWDYDHIGFMLTLSEVDQLITALSEAKERLQSKKIYAK